jgi:1-acyl-sn-glycerol-3-phosphate acyltransferase
MSQAHGLLGWAVDRMIRRSVRARFRNIYWSLPADPLPRPCILCCNHHNWFDGYVMYHVATKMGLPVVDWIAEFDAFPLFAKVGGLPFPPNDALRRAATLKKTIRSMQAGERSLLVFGEGILHSPPEIWPIGKAVELVARKTNAPIVPVALYYEFALHERPECWIRFGAPLPSHCSMDQLRDDLEGLLEELKVDVRASASFDVLAEGTGDVNERWDMRRRFGRR